MENQIVDRVKRFYDELPFNYFGSMSRAVEQIKLNPIRAYPDLRRLLLSDQIQSLLEFGCSTGWFSNAAAYHYSKKATGIDLSTRALDYARQVAELLGTTELVEFVESDLFEFDRDCRTCLVVSIGVLHHTQDARLAFNRIQRFVREGGWVFIGLYHYYGRKVFREMFEEILTREGEEAAFQRYKAMQVNKVDEYHLRSWFRDQVLHPHETLHTLAETLEWLDECGFDLVSTSINQFQEFQSTADLLPLEKHYEELSVQRNVKEGRFFPGFFTIMARKRGR